MKRIIARVPLLILCLSLVLFSFCAAVSGEEAEITVGEQMPDEYFDFLDGISEDLREHLPPSLFDKDSQSVADGVRQLSDFSYLLQTLLSLVGLCLGDCAKALGTIAGLLILSSICRALRSSFGQESVGRAFSLCSTLVIMLGLLTQSNGILQRTVSYFDNLSKMTSGSLPLMGALYAMGGNVGTAVASSAGLSVFMTVLEVFVTKSILPFCGFCMAFALIGAIDPSMRLGSLSGTLKKNYTTALAFLMMLLLAMLGAQTTLAARSDTIAMRSAKFAAGNLIPVVGGSVSELLRSVSAGVSYLRTTVGICGVLILLLTLLPTLVELLLFRLTWQLSASLADMLGCDSEKKLLDEFASLLGFLIAAVSICSSVLLLSMTLLAHCASAIG